MDKRSDTFTLDGTCSTQEAARSVGVSYVSLRRWLGTRGSGPFHKWLRAHDRAPLGYLFLGEKRQQKVIWRFGSDNCRALREFIAERGCAERCQAASRREKDKKTGFVRKTDNSVVDLMKARRRYRAAVRDLRKMGLKPKNEELVSATAGKLGSGV